ncbi:MAG: hypothetical protein ABIJ28_03860 [Patescibacteria group bacterium]
MDINNIDFFHGAVFSRIIDNSLACIEKHSGNNSSYIINNITPIYIKYSKKRISPWSFSFIKTHIEEINKAINGFENIFVVLICNTNGICCLNYQEFCAVISVESNDFPKWIKTQRQKGEKYTVTGSDGKLTYKIGNSDFPQKLF